MAQAQRRTGTQHRRKDKSYNRDMEDAQAKPSEERKMLEELSGKMQVVIEKYAQANAYTVLLDVSNQNTNVIWISTAIDVTKDVIELYDKMNPGGRRRSRRRSLNKRGSGDSAVTPKKQP